MTEVVIKLCDLSIVPDILLSNTLISDALCNPLPPPGVLDEKKKSFQLLQVSYKKLGYAP
jgi:hypothetical protein